MNILYRIPFKRSETFGLTLSLAGLLRGLIGDGGRGGALMGIVLESPLTKKPSSGSNLTFSENVKGTGSTPHLIKCSRTPDSVLNSLMHLGQGTESWPTLFR